MKSAANNYRNFGWMGEIPTWERQLFREATQAATREATYTASDKERPSGSPGDWIPYGRSPLEFIPPLDHGEPGENIWGFKRSRLTAPLH